MAQWQLIYFEDCPNAEKLKLALEEIGLNEFEKVVQGTLEPSNPLKSYTSPSLLKDGKLIVGALTGTSEGGCSLCLPSLEELNILVGEK